MRIQPLSRTDEGAIVNERVNNLITPINRFEEDQFIPTYAADTGSGTAYVIAPSPGIKSYVVGQVFAFKALNANTSTTPTLAVNGLTAGTIARPGGALVAGDIAANGSTVVQVIALSSGTPTFHLLNPQISSGKSLQFVSTETGAVATGTTTVPADDTIPQSTEGDQYMTLSITPKSATSTLIIRVTFNWSLSTLGNSAIVSLFQDSTANALASVAHTQYVAGAVNVTTFPHIMTSGTTSATTFKVRAGPVSAGTLTFNGQAGGRFFGGVYASSITIEEVVP
mgnify:CR=1 FL=1